MGLADRLRRKRNIDAKPKIGGRIGYYQLADWWLATFTADEREHIEDMFRPMGFWDADRNPRPLTQGEIRSLTPTATQFLYELSGWFNNAERRSIAGRMLDKAEDLTGHNILDRHFLYHQMVRVYDRDSYKDPHALDLVVAACKKQIALAPQAIPAFREEMPELNGELPVHTGYDQLTIICEKQGDYAESIRLSREAMSQGWRGDWERRIARCEKRRSAKSAAR